MNARDAIAYYITAHGYGHGTRSCDILRAIRERDPARPLTVVSDLPQSFLDSRLGDLGCRFRAARFDVGMVQLDSIRVDIGATLRECRELLSRADGLLEAEIRFLEAENIGAVVCDIPSVPLRAAKAAGIPALGAGNFAWDWIYEAFVDDDPAWREIVEHFRGGYALCDLLMRMPFAEPMAAFPRRIDIGVTARPGRARRVELAALTGANPAKPWVLLSFASLSWDDAALRNLHALRDWDFFTVRPLAWEGPNIHAVDRRIIPYADVLASCDVVLTKPGFGVLAECAVNCKPIVYVERTDFREYPILEAAVKRYYRHIHLPSERLYRGDLRAALEAIASAPEPTESVPAGGDVQAAELILDRVRQESVSTR